ncbi:hypothetical protein RFM26_09110 [Mesorhizobium sp. VK23B]|uniref:Uncharacterized protein n=1 Tax=Mesorhizobium dulcispinae TaxID=3072316 RepID=A0ABU4X980_9HYPH|nr:MULTISPECIES: hypothetical protein [unclassified Mesorhizobium]MDX8465839.1 hypothetical protein [Mesorhizobium sp. VK23B]MDX8471359.1 hypothetical protein [Mesorhizobium sp. VK23A]
MTALLPAELAWYATGRFYRAKDGAVADYGYFLHLPFPNVPMFDGKRSEVTAHFTFAARPFNAQEIDNGVLSLGLDPVGEFSLYLQRRPMGKFDDPASFEQGECIATFRRASLAVGTTVAVSAGTAMVQLIGTNVFSARLVASSAFEFGGGRHDLAHYLGEGVTQFGTSAATPIAPPPTGYDLVLPFTGSAIALGRAG